MLTPEAEKLVAGAQGMQDQLRMLAAARQRATNRKHPTIHRVNVDAQLRSLYLPCMQSTLYHGCPVWKAGPSTRFVSLDGSVLEGAVLGTMQKIPHALGQGVADALAACRQSRSRSRSRTRTRLALAAAARKVRDWAS